MLPRILPLICLAALGSSAVSELCVAEQPTDWSDLKLRRQSSSQARIERPDRKPHKLVTRIYAVADLVIPTPALAVVSIDAPVGNSREPERSSPEFESLIERITETIQPASWKNAGGRGSIDAQPKTLSLVVTHTEAVHKKIADLIVHLRREQDIQVTVEVRILEVSDRFFEQMGADVDVDSDGGQPIIDARRVKRILEAAQSDARSNILSAPKITLFNGQTLWMSNAAGEQEHSLVLNPAISPDRRSTQLTVAARGVKDGSPVILNDTIRVPDGQTLLLDCGPQRARVAKARFTSGVPYVSRLLPNTATPERMRTLFLITPRIIVQEEEEELLGLPPVAQTRN